MGDGLIDKALRAVGHWKKRRGARYRDAGDQARDRGDWAAAASSYRTYLAIKPDDFAIWVQLGHAAKETGELAAAEQAYRRAEAIEPNDADLALNIGHLMKSMRRRDEALRYYARSYDLNGNQAAHAELVALGENPVRRTRTVQTPERSADVVPPRRFVGAIDSFDGLEIRGWAIEPEADGPAVVDISTSDGRVIATATATRMRADIVRAGYATAAAGFSVFVDVGALGDGDTLLHLRLRSTGEALDGSPMTLALGGAAGAAGGSVKAVRYAVAKPLAAVSGEHAIFVAYAPTGMLQPFVRRYLALLAEQGISVSLVVNAVRPVLLDDAVLASVASAVVRENVGYDFGAWAQMLQIEPRLYGAQALYIINDSVFGPRDAESFAQLIAACRANPADLVGPTETLERGWHIQSYFLRASGRLIASYGFQFFVNAIRVVADKDQIIDEFEVPLTARVREAGFEADAVFKVDEARNPTLFAWRALLEADFPFVKLLLLRGKFAHIDSKGIRKALRRKGFDLGLLDATLAYGTDEAPKRGAFPLLARPRRNAADGVVVPPKPYKVAFYGPWNYDNGLGSASRGIIGAIRRAGVRLNLHPIKVPFHVHAPLVPSHDVVDFEGPADIAVVHLNPDSWHLLTDDQRRDIARAGKRIGYWVWEMDHLPPLWRREFSSVERIWAPSGYCARLFADQDEAPVDVVPHAVPVDAARATDRARVLKAIGVAGDARVILYIFDGSSYLVRKNPAALVRAFAASGLAEAGWTLVLKTKHLMDRADDGRALAALAGGTPGVVVLDRSLTSGELADLLAAADIYASPHCAEGFGLTVAEAMAAGKSVVATDFSGTTQYLDATCGFPVAAQPWTLEEDFGHYTKGGSWARIDEDALTAALRDAAARIDAGDGSIGEAARARIADTLSYEAVGAAIAASFDAVLRDDVPIRRPQPAITGEEDVGIPLAELKGDDALAVLSLAAGTLTPVTGDALARVRDDRDHWLMLAGEDARVHPLTAHILSRHAARRPDVAIFHADDVALGHPTLMEQVRLKPEFDQTLFAAQDYIGGPLFVRGSALHALGGLNANAGDATLYDLVLRAVEQGLSIGRIPEVLAVLSGERVIAPVTARRTAIAASPLYAGYDVMDGLTPDSLGLSGRFDADAPMVTLCVPTRRTVIPGEDRTYIERFLTSIAAVDWPRDRLTVLIGDDVEGVPDWAERDWPFALRRIETPRAAGEPFNYSAKMNRLWCAADSDVIVLMNDDVVARDAGWLKALATFAVDGSIGGVGARLLYDDGTIQHAGTVGGILGTSVHAWLGRRAGAPTYQDWAMVQREWSMVTGAVFATRRNVLEAVGGFDEGFSLEFNDVDLCLKIRQAGWRIVYTPFAEMTHSERASRLATVPPGEQTALFLSRWQGWLSDDPALPPRMRRDLIDLTPSAGRGDWFA